MLKNLTFDRIEQWAKRNIILVTVFLIVLFISSALTIMDGGRRLFEIYQSTIGRNTLNYEKIGALSTQTNIDYFSAFFGPPVFKNRRGKYLEHVFIDRDFYVLAVTDNEGKVLLYSVTTRSKDFNPRLNLGYLSSNDKSFFVVLGKTTFKEIPFDPLKIISNSTMHDMSYKEKYYFGNPGLYQNYNIAVCGVGVKPKDLPFLEDVMYKAEMRKASVPMTEHGRLSLKWVKEMAQYESWYEPMSGKLSAPLMRHRETAQANTFSVSEPLSDDIDEKVSICPDKDQVRLLGKNNQPKSVEADVEPDN